MIRSCLDALTYAKYNDCFYRDFEHTGLKVDHFIRSVGLPYLNWAKNHNFKQKVLLYLKYLSYDFKQCLFHDNCGSHLPRDQPAICFIV